MHTRIKETSKSEPIRARRKHKSADAPYNPRSEAKRNLNASFTGVMHIRANVETTYTSTTTEETKQKKSSFLLNTPKMRLTQRINRESLAELVHTQNANVATHRPIEEVTNRSETGSPTEVITPGRTTLYRQAKTDFYQIFSNQTPDTSPEIKRAVDDSFFVTSPFAQVIANTTTVKEFTLNITPKLLKQAAKLPSRNQNKAMAASGVDSTLASAARYASASKLFSDGVEFEWLHLIAYHVLGEEAQAETNLGCGTTHANTNMIIAEAGIAQLATRYPNGFTLEVKATFIPNSQLLQEVEYILRTSDYSLPFRFNAQTAKQPELYHYQYIQNLIKALKTVPQSDKTPSPVAPTQPSQVAAPKSTTTTPTTLGKSSGRLLFFNSMPTESDSNRAGLPQQPITTPLKSRHALSMLITPEKTAAVDESEYKFTPSR